MEPALAIVETIAIVVLVITVLRLRRRLGEVEDRANRAAISRLSQEMKEKADEQLRTILDGLAEGFIVVDASQRVSFANARVKELFPGRRAWEGRTLIETMRDPRFPDIVQLAQEEDCRHVQRFKVTAEGEAGRELVLAVDAAPLPGWNGGGAHYRLVLHDETAQHEAEQVRKDFVANASHELRTPLTIINGYTENLLDGAIEDPEMAKRFLSVMKKHGDRIARIIEDMLTISRLESGGVESLKLEEFSMAECAADVIERLHLVAEERGAKIKRDFPKDSMITGDRFYWDQIMFNLIENALKQNRQPGLTVSVSMRWDGAYFELSVGDDGIGIPGADLPYIFKRFYRVEKHHSTQEIKGTGLGLSIVKRAIEAHGGTINVSSSPGKETRFTIRAPREPKREEMLPLEEKVS